MKNEKVKEIFWKCYNDFWNKWKEEVLPRESEQWEEMCRDAQDIMTKYHCNLCRTIILALMTELEERGWGNGGNNVRAYKITRESELTMEEKIEAVKSYGIADLLYVIREFEEDPDKYEPEVIRQIGIQLNDKGIRLMY